MFNKGKEYKTDIQKSVSFLCISKCAESQSRKVGLFTIVLKNKSKRNQFRVNLSKKIKYLCNKKYEHWEKKFKEILEEKDLPSSLNATISNLNMTIILKYMDSMQFS